MEIGLYSFAENTPDPATGVLQSPTERLKDLIEEIELAEQVGVTRKTVNTVENGEFTPSATLAIKLAAALGLSVEQLFWIEPQ